MSNTETVSVKLSELNLKQLLDVHAVLTRQQDEAVAKSQELALQLDAIKDQRLELADTIRKHQRDLLGLSALIKKKEISIEGAEVDPDATVGAVLGEASGVVLDISASSGS